MPEGLRAKGFANLAHFQLFCEGIPSLDVIEVAELSILTNRRSPWGFL